MSGRQRPRLPVVDELAEDDLTINAVVLWGLIRQRIASDVPRVFFRHRREFYADHGSGNVHGHMAPLLARVPQDLLEERGLAKERGPSAE